ncbi:MAG: M67 family metallopeptidase [Cyanobacteria bacterium K_DeepCast_35m_m2_155]|nr:M67 family metallopeptidase [Cyanobacteria bacterium K_DeepCast_35m_m2_155]
MGVTSITPVRITVDRGALITLESVLGAASPAEGCALLLGSAAACTRVQQIWPCLNCWPDPAQRHRRFALDPREQLHAQRWCRQRGLGVIGVAHSHPSSDPVPSELDCQLTMAPALMLIGTPLGALADLPQGHSCRWQWAFWWLDEPAEDGKLRAPTPLPWTMAD